MFTSRAEYRLSLREDNADERLTPAGRELGLVDDERWCVFETRRDAVEREQRRLEQCRLHPESLPADDAARLGTELRRETTAAALLRRPDINYAQLAALSVVGGFDDVPGSFPELDEQIVQQLEVRAKYAGYIERQQREIAQHEKQESLQLPADIDYRAIHGLSNEARQRLLAAQPVTLGQASRLEGMTPSAVSLILIHLKKRQLKKTA
jgi:tRNA uridine 5-carboxymethylaminomethyl modification enzyme